MDVLTQLPAKHRRTVVVKVSPVDATKLRELRQNLEAADKDSGGEQSWESMMALGEMWRAAGLAKLNALKDYMRDLLGASDESVSESSSGKMLVFAHHLAVLDEAQKVAVNARVGFIRIDGSTSQADRHSAVQRFQNDSKVRLAILSIKAAGCAKQAFFEPLYTKNGQFAKTGLGQTWEKLRGKAACAGRD
jgi:SWI/SNF-related matrix-associated actin-dependent regulator 1 of chromatin subfamily A